MIFLTVGTLFPFDRLVRAVDDAVKSGLVKEPVFAQIGRTSFAPKNIEYVKVLEKHTFDNKVADADYLISHAGIGSIAIALERNKPLLVMPRMKCFKEHVNDHQVATARKFEQLGHVLAAYSVEELPDKIKELSTFRPKPRASQADSVARRIAQFLNELSASARQ